MILLLSALLSAYYAARVPYGRGLNPDETAHYGYLQLLIANRGLVHFVPPAGVVADGQPEPWETHQPPLYYLLCLPVYIATGGSVFAVRLVSVVFQLGTVALVYRAGRDLFPQRSEIALGAAAFTAFLPSQAQLGGAINNDSLTTLICVAALWRLGSLIRQGQSVRGAIWLGILLGAGLWTKLTVFQLFPLLIIAYLLAVRAGNLTGRQGLARVCISVGLSLLVASPWLVRNTLLYGDPLAQHIYLQTGPNLSPVAIQKMLHWTAAQYLQFSGIRTFGSFWSLLPPSLLKPPPLLLLVTVLLALGGGLGAYRLATRTTDAGERSLIGFLFAGVVLLIPFFAKFILTTFQAQGRYFLPALLPVALLTVLGWSEWGGTSERGRTIAVLVVVSVVLGLNLFPFSTF